MQFSIVITTFNRLSLLKRAVHSALTQTIPCEVIVVDDCSSDSTPEYLKQLEGQIIYQRNSKNLGHSSSVNLGVQLAKGDWVKLIDDDDYLESNYLETIKSGIEKYPQSVICSCQSIQVDLEGREISRSLPIGSEQIFYISQPDIHYGMLLEQVPFGTPVQVAFRRDAFLKSGGWDSRFDLVYDDIDSWVRIAQFGDGILINQYLAYRTIWNESFHQKFSLDNRLQANFLIKEKIYSLVNEKYKNVIPPLSDIHNYLKLYWGLVALKKKFFMEFFKLANWSLISFSAWIILLKILYSKGKVKFLYFNKKMI